MTATRATLQGGCHCGTITLVLSTTRVPADTVPRACDCSFCRAHGAAWVSDANAQLIIHAHRPECLRRYRQGSLAAQFLLCGECGVLLAVLFEDGERTYAAVNTGCLEERDAFAPTASTSPQRLSPEEKLARWRQLWIGEVSLQLM
ncbi:MULTISPECIES: GFA family protein [unclassified Pseudoxanthomonas]|uniref:GFA family protein n=1 Tax=unclassified Pseudoxanthomonas TaxID=2645906 RepID=UPI0008F25A68|nr:MULTISPECIES: GFA family protein [unclassified Pseudoxanthomonas]PPJ43224.1 aldehyde-activating protein [Pseudoxanthomonas sp. KAs_5_3]SFV34522.1 Uncharacterized conserved protein [Pseudoxanthomonas sp. YR558]